MQVKLIVMGYIAHIYAIPDVLVVVTTNSSNTLIIISEIRCVILIYLVVTTYSSNTSIIIGVIRCNTDLFTKQSCHCLQSVSLQSYQPSLATCGAPHRDLATSVWSAI